MALSASEAPSVCAAERRQRPGAARLRSVTHALRRALALALGLAAAAAGGFAAAASNVNALSVSQVAPGVYVHAGLLEDWVPENGGDVANLGFVVGSRCVAVIDTGGTPGIGRALRAAVAQTTPLPVCYVINTHAHPDHVLGNTAFEDAGPNAQTPTFVAHAQLTAALAAREPYFRNALKRDFGLDLPAPGTVYPRLAVVGQAEIDLGGRVLQLNGWPTAHTNNDLTVYDRQTRTLFLSDLLFVRHLPVLDGNLRGWLAVLKDIEGFDVAVAVPGHGPASKAWPAVLDAERRYLEQLLNDTRAAIKQGKTIQQAVDSISVAAAAGSTDPWLLIERFHRRNITAAYAELEWE